MKRFIMSLGVAGFACAISQAAFAEGSRIFHSSFRLRGEYDDNIFQTSQDEEDSFKFIAELDLSLNFNQPQTFFGLHYRPSFVYWTDRPGDDSDLNHHVDLILNHEFTPRYSLSIKDRFRYAEIPEGIANDVIVREENNFIYNSLNATFSSRLNPETRFDIGGRNIVLQYDEDNIGRQQDYVRNVIGVSLSRQHLPTLTLLADARYEDLGYDDADIRDSQSAYVGIGAEQTFSQSLLGGIRAGYQYKEFDSAVRDSTDSPFVDANVTALPSPATRLTFGVAFSQTETDLFPFSNQERTRLYLNAAHDVTAKISAFLSASYAKGDFSADEAVAGSDVADGSEDTVQFSARATYQMDRNNIFELGYQFTDLDSDYDRDYTRNRLNIGWSFLF